MDTLKRISRGKFTKARIKSLYEAAITSGGIKDGMRGIVFEIRHVLSIIEDCNRFILELEKQMSHYLKNIPYSQYILSIKGIGKVTTAGIIGEVGDFSKFNIISELEKLAGLDLYEISSGKHKGRRRISKRGHPLLRKLLYFAAMNCVRKGGILYGWYQETFKRGKSKVKALVAVSRKLLGIIFALVRDHSEYMKDYSKIQSLKSVA